MRERFRRPPTTLSGRRPRTELLGGISWLDFKLGLRMLIKYPGLTLVGGVALAVAIAFSAGFFEASRQITAPTLPFEDGGEIVALQNRDVAENDVDRRALHSFVVWRDELTTVQDLGAAAQAERNLVSADGRSQAVRGMQISASAFRITRVPPLLGRPLVEADEEPSAPPVVVIGNDIWRSHFGEDPDVVGRSMRFGAVTHTIVGVMPRGYKFPINEELWIPLRLNPLDYGRGEGPGILIFGRLAPGSSLTDARVELAAIGERLAADRSPSQENLRPQILRFTAQLTEGAQPGVYTVRTLLLIFLGVACANVGTLIFAHSATRESEIAIRTALGAGRKRIVMQLFVEALVLSSCAAAVGLGAASWGLSVADGLITSLAPGQLPFWWEFSLSLNTVLYVGLLAVFAAVLAGVLPALKVTGKGLKRGLNNAAAGGSGLRFGRGSTVIIVTQVALSVGFLTWAALVVDNFAWTEEEESRLDFNEHLSVQTAMASVSASSPASEEGRQRESIAKYYESRRILAQRLRAEPAVRGVTFADKLPGQEYDHRWVEVQGMNSTTGEQGGRRVSRGVVDPNFFEVFGARVTKGRTFNSQETGEVEVVTPQDDVPGAVVVNEAFVERILRGNEPLGLFIRFGPLGVEPSGAWFQIVGVVGNLTMDPFRRDEAPGVYHPVTPSSVGLSAGIELGTDPMDFGPRLLRIGAETAPSLLLTELRPVGAVTDIWRMLRRLGILAISAATSITLLLSVSGIYALMSFIVAQRTREIGIRSALGAEQRKIVLQIFSRALLQLGGGVAVGVAVLGVFSIELTELRSLKLLVPIAAAIVSMGLVACAVPTWRALKVQPTEALREGGT